MEGNHTNRFCVGLRLMCWVLCVVFLYVASFGPAHGLVLRGRLPHQFLRAFYVMLPKNVAWRSLQLWTRLDGEPTLRDSGLDQARQFGEDYEQAG